MDPGQKLSKCKVDFKTLLDNKEDLNNYCPYCVVPTSAEKGKITKHCYSCNKCIIDLDHHCLWINNCVGENNSKTYFIFLLILMINSLHKLYFICAFSFKISDTSLIKSNFETFNLPYLSIERYFFSFILVIAFLASL